MLGMLTAVCYRVLYYGDRLFWTDSGESLYRQKEMGWLHLWQQAGLLLVQTGAVFMVLYLVYRIGVLGAGDVKLYCMSAVFLDSGDFFSFLTASFSFAAAIALLKLIYQKNARERLYYFCSYVVDVARLGRFKLYWEDTDVRMRKQAGLHMAGPMLAGLLFHMCGLW